MNKTLLSPIGISKGGGVGYLFYKEGVGFGEIERTGTFQGAKLTVTFEDENMAPQKRLITYPLDFEETSAVVGLIYGAIHSAHAEGQEDSLSHYPA